MKPNLGEPSAPRASLADRILPCGLPRNLVSHWRCSGAILGPVSVVLLLLLAAVPLAATRAAELRGAAGAVDITPTQPVRLGGYESRKELSQGVHDSLGARVLAFEETGRKLVLVSVDTLGF